MLNYLRNVFARFNQWLVQRFTFAYLLARFNLKIKSQRKIIYNETHRGPQIKEPKGSACISCRTQQTHLIFLQSESSDLPENNCIWPTKINNCEVVPSLQGTTLLERKKTLLPVRLAVLPYCSESYLKGSAQQSNVNCLEYYFAK